MYSCYTLSVNIWCYALKSCLQYLLPLNLETFNDHTQLCAWQFYSQERSKLMQFQVWFLYPLISSQFSASKTTFDAASDVWHVYTWVKQCNWFQFELDMSKQSGITRWWDSFAFLRLKNEASSMYDSNSPSSNRMIHPIDIKYPQMVLIHYVTIIHSGTEAGEIWCAG